MATFQKGKPRPKNAGRKKGSENKITADVKAMVLGALTRAGGEDYLLRQAEENPKSFLVLLGRIMPMQVTGADGRDLIPAETDPSKVALAVLTVLRAARGRAGEPGTGSGAPEAGGRSLRS